MSRFILALGLATLLAMPARAQVMDDLYLFGFFQTQYRHSSEIANGEESSLTSFSLQQLNAFLNKDFSPRFNAFISAELTNSFSTEEGFGNLKLEEAWVRYSPNAAFNLKGGILVPTFNNMNDIKNRTPLLPYIFRPVVYESSFSSVLPIYDYAPGRAFIQANGMLRSGKVRFDYAAYLGNNDTVTRETVGSYVAGTDTSTAFLVGGRVGVRYNSFKAGFSTASDFSNQAQLGFGTVPRIRFGGDVSFTLKGAFVEAEWIGVQYTLDETEQAALTYLGAEPMIGKMPNFLYGVSDMDKLFYYGTVGYNITDRLFAYGSYSYIQDNGLSFLKAGIPSYGGGAGFRPIDPVVLKAQYARVEFNENAFFNFTSNMFFLAASVQF